MLRGYAPRYSADKSSNGIISFDFDVHRRQSEMHVSNLIISCSKCHAVYSVIKGLNWLPSKPKITLANLAKVDKFLCSQVFTFSKECS